MSHVANYIILTQELDDGETFSKLNDALRDTANGHDAFKRIDEGAGGYKNLEAEVFIYAYAGNYQPLEELTQAMRDIEWDEPESVQLLYKGQHDDVWRFINWRAE